jgi:FkbM family methyltransferase
MALPIKFVIVDVGAGLSNYYFDWIQQYKGLIIHAIEPHPELAEKLRTKLEGLERVFIYEYALTDDDDQDFSNFYKCSHPASSSILPLNTTNLRRWRNPMGQTLLKNTDTIQVEALSLESFLTRHSIKGHINLLNIDVQGCALNVLRGIRSKRVWEVIKEINVKVHSIDWDLYENQTKLFDVMQLCQNHFFTLQEKKSLSRDQEDLLSFRNQIAVMKKWPFDHYSWAKKALNDGR